MNKTVFIVALPQEVELTHKILDCPVIYSGVGKINATIAAYKAFNEGYANIINIGSCGSLNHSAGEVLKINSVFQDIDGTPLCDYGETPFEAKGNSKQIVLSRESNITCFTTDYFYDHSQQSKYSNSYLNSVHSHNVFDMECFALAKVCKKFNLNFTSYKWVSDDGDASNWEENCKLGFEKVKNILINEDFSNR